MFIENLSHLEDKQTNVFYCETCISRTLRTLKQFLYTVEHKLLQLTLRSYNFYFSTHSTISMLKH